MDTEKRVDLKHNEVEPTGYSQTLNAPFGGGDESKLTIGSFV